MQDVFLVYVKASFKLILHPSPVDLKGVKCLYFAEIKGGVSREAFLKHTHTKKKVSLLKPFECVHGRSA